MSTIITTKDATAHTMIPMIWLHEDTRTGHELPRVEWCRWNADGSFYVDWERAAYLMEAIPNPPYDMQQMDTKMMAVLLFAARDNITCVSLAEAEQIAKNTAEKYNQSHHGPKA